MLMLCMCTCIVSYTYITIYIKELLCMLRYWNWVIIMDNVRLERRIFMWDYNKGGDNWSNKISIILNSINGMYVYRNKTW